MTLVQAFLMAALVGLAAAWLLAMLAVLLLALRAWRGADVEEDA